MKTCAECGRSYSISRVLCLDCCEILEERTYLRLVWVTLAVAVLFHLALGKFGYAGRGLVKESVMTEPLLLIVCVLIWKGIQKWREPQRRILLELASLYSDRAGRLMIFAIVVLLVLTSTGTMMPGAPKIEEPHALVWFRLVRYVIVIVGGFTYMLLAVLIQGRGFFDFKSRNSLIQHELEHRDGSG